MTNENVTEPGAAPEFSRIVVADDIGLGGSTVEIEASAEERTALAGRFDLLAIDGLRARAVISRCPARDGSGTVLRVAFDLDADVVQRCIVTLEPLPAHIHQTGLVAEYRQDAEPEPAAEFDIAPEGVDPPELLVDGRFDLGELVAEHLALALDPYPRAQGAASDLPAGTTDGTTEAGDAHPFAALRRWSGRTMSDGD